MGNRVFKVKITAGTDIGPYNIYYNSGSGNVLATFNGTSNQTLNIPYIDLITGDGVTILIPDTAVTITLYNTRDEIIDSCTTNEVVYYMATPTPTATPTSTPTPTSTATPTSTPVPPTSTPTPTPTPTNISYSCYEITGYWEFEDPQHPGGGYINYVDQYGDPQSETNIWLSDTIIIYASSIDFSVGVNINACGSPTSTPTSTSTGCVTGVSFEVDVDGPVVYVNCNNVAVTETYGIGPQGIIDCIKINTLGAVSGGGAVISNIIYDETSCTLTATPTPTPTSTSSNTCIEYLITNTNDPQGTADNAYVDYIDCFGNPQQEEIPAGAGRTICAYQLTYVGPGASISPNGPCVPPTPTPTATPSPTPTPTGEGGLGDVYINNYDTNGTIYNVQVNSVDIFVNVPGFPVMGGGYLTGNYASSAGLSTVGVFVNVANDAPVTLTLLGISTECITTPGYVEFTNLDLSTAPALSITMDLQGTPCQ